MAAGSRPVADYLSARRRAVELVAAAIVVAFGVNLIAAGLIAGVRAPAWAVAAVGVLITLLGLFLVLSWYERLGTREVQLAGVFGYEHATNTLVQLDRYRYSEQIQTFLDAGFAELPAMEAAWKEQPLTQPVPVTAELGEASVAILCEATEYFLIDEVSSHLQSHAEEHNPALAWEIIGRSDVPDILLQNRFFELFSRPLSERVGFDGDGIRIVRIGADDEEDEVVSAYGSDGRFFSRFELALPRDARVRRVGTRTIEMETSKLALELSVEPRVWATTFPSGFARFYLRRASFSEVGAYQIRVAIRVRMKRGARFSMRGLQQDQWVDALISRLEDVTSFDRHVKKIGWHVALTTAIATGAIHRRRDGLPAPPTDAAASESSSSGTDQGAAGNAAATRTQDTATETQE